jgi:hypothetical protein
MSKAELTVEDIRAIRFSQSSVWAIRPDADKGADDDGVSNGDPLESR